MVSSKSEYLNYFLEKYIPNKTNIKVKKSAREKKNNSHQN